MWDLPRPGLEPVSPALAGRFSTTAPPGKPGDFVLIEKMKVLVVEKWLGMEVTNTGFATRLPRFKFSLCHVRTSYN